MNYESSRREKGSVPPFSLKTLAIMMISGSVATIAFDNWGQAISPGVLGWANLAPVPLAQGTLQTVFGVNSRSGAEFMHLFVVGLIAYPFGWLFVFRPIQEKVYSALPWQVSSAIYGFGLWIVAIGIVASTVTGNLFLNWTDITWVALVGHTLYGIVCAWIVNWLEVNGLG